MHSRQPNKVSSCCCCRLDYRTRHNERTNIEILAHSAARADVMECLVFFFPLFISYPPPTPIFSSLHLTLTRPSFSYTLPPPSSPSSYPTTPYFLAVSTAAWYSQQTDVPSAKHGGEQKHSTIDWYIVVHMQHALHASRDVTTLPCRSQP